MPSRRVLSRLAAALLPLLWAGAASAGTLIFRSSSSYDSGGSDNANAVAVSSGRAVYAAGTAGSDFFTIRFDTALAVVSSAAFTDGGADTAYGVAAAADGSVYVVGEGSSHLLLVKYDAALHPVGSTTLSIGLEDTPQAVAVDASGNVFAAGTTFDGASFRIFLAKFSPALALLNQTTWAPSGQTFGYGLALDPSGQPVVAGQGFDSDYNVKVGKFSASLSLLASASFDTPGHDDQGRAVAVSSMGVVYVAAQTGPAGAGNFDLLMLEYGSGLSLISSSTYDSGGDDRAQAAGIDRFGEAYLSGFVSPGAQTYAMTIRYSPSLVSVSSVTVNAGLSDKSFGLALDPSDGSVFTGGSSDDGVTTNFVVRRWAGPPVLGSSQSAQQGGAGQVLTFSGDNFSGGSTLTISDGGIVVNGSGAASPTSYVMNLDVGASVPLGLYDVVLTNPDGASSSASAFFPVVKTAAVTAAGGGAVQAVGAAGLVRVDVPAGAYASDIQLTLARPASLPAADAALRATGVAFESTESPALSPTQNVVVSMGYAPAGLGTIPESGLFIAYYDTLTSAWTPMPSTVDTVNHVVVSTSSHLTLFQLMARANSATVPLGVTVYPNPYKPGSSGPYGDGAGGSGMTFANLPADFRLKIYDSWGRRIYETSGRAVNGRWLWDTGTSVGGRAGSGVYVYQVFNADGGPAGKGKFVIIR